MSASKEEILRAAAHLLPRRPNASMAEVAAAAGISRATLHRIIPSRERLVEELCRMALREALAALDRARPEEGDPADAVRRVVEELLPIADLYAMLSSESQLWEVFEQDEGWVDWGERLVALFRRGQERGRFRVDMSAEWLADALGALLIGAGWAALDGRLADRETRRAVAELLLTGAVRGEG
ncbi:TetR family transcriptional regulator [Longimycelium tulufanense]|uniref:TetR family transcriptional regulator n=1 Tax=Longimycelium tulufanense TaxID=907463 RepID=A0A8J3FTQ0_9PSEU|nr:TetR family transcriptional regulator [Longimycelium tulufanense]GGM48035.1 TetR family transcriptional regulator [Longimycelium tulufanense]